MKKVNMVIVLSTLFIFYQTLAFSQIESEKAKIHINNTRKIKDDVKMILHQPALDESRVFVTPDKSFDLAGEIDNFDSSLQVYLNNKPIENTDGNFFWQNKISLEPGSNTIKIDIIKNKKPLKSYHYNLYYTAPVTNLADISFSNKDYHALIIGINSYPGMGENLQYAIRDAKAIYNILTERYTFRKENMTLLLNPRREDLYIAFDKLSSELQEKDNLLIFYAGHGLWEEDTGLGYWLPSDALRENRAEWFPNSSLVDYLKAIKSKHTLLISDACFAGSIFKTHRSFGELTESIEELYNLPSRKAITSGTLSEVPDQSIFIEYLVDRLKNNTSKYLPSESLYSRIRVAVENNSPTIPRTGVIQGVGDEGGDFIFILK